MLGLWGFGKVTISFFEVPEMLKFAVLALVFSPALAWYDFPFSPQKTRELMAALPSINLVAETSFFVLEVGSGRRHSKLDTREMVSNYH